MKKSTSHKRQGFISAQKGLSIKKIDEVFKGEQRLPVRYRPQKTKEVVDVKIPVVQNDPYADNPQTLKALVKKKTQAVSKSEVIAPYKKYTLQEAKERMSVEILNNNRICIINEPTNLKNIICNEPIARWYFDKGYKIIWPVSDNLCALNKHSNYITFLNKSLISIDYKNRNFQNLTGSLVVPLQHANELSPQRYDLWDMPANIWQAAKWKRDDKAERKLFYDILGLRDGEPYNLINCYYHNDLSGKAQIVPQENIKNIYLERILDFTLMDWSMVIEKATTIHTITNALIYWIEFLNINAVCHLYNKPNNVIDIKDLKITYASHNS